MKQMRSWTTLFDIRTVGKLTCIACMDFIKEQQEVNTKQFQSYCHTDCTLADRIAARKFYITSLDIIAFQNYCSFFFLLLSALNMFFYRSQLTYKYMHIKRVTIGRCLSERLQPTQCKCEGIIIFYVQTVFHPPSLSSLVLCVSIARCWVDCP